MGHDGMRRSYEQAMHEALQLARQAADEGEVPVGALVLDADGQILGQGRNRRENAGDPLAHAEVEAMRAAAQALRKQQSADGSLTSVASREPVLAEPVSKGPVANESAPNARHAPWNLAECTLVVTLEPCPMCAGAALQAHVGRIVFGAWDAKLGACGSVWDIPRDPHVGSHPEVIGGVEEEACMALLRDFFRTRRL
ncbi:nucleoside deaminase [Bifidobacterium tibiigranuli]|jgi:tRNA(adenine34) deaminase|uniref:nucleoside deaminase n=2 Tax=Bifidobacterium tibiigranuli TaxID=2172043 RepID=UPI0026ED0A72|nr:nucleoside deaminase [Bifidobacterium tibiigranuli]MCI1650268.1 nucleoside deaminase [Bifidobacterium tibiigranuli]MCI2186347.1 nucleoside deaminase [Bifidobacterium tibiigranuli]MCI2203827.1 nucleoside deaminase [Bifidobacterium tibiigranuli]